MLVDAIHAANADADGWITVDDLYKMNAWVGLTTTATPTSSSCTAMTKAARSNFHLVQGDGGSAEYFGPQSPQYRRRRHVPHRLRYRGRPLPQRDGDANQTLERFPPGSTISTAARRWCRTFRRRRKILGTAAQEELVGEGGNDTIDGGGGSDLIYGGWGDDSITGGAGTDIIYGGTGRDKLDGSQDGDIYHVTGNGPMAGAALATTTPIATPARRGVDIIQAVGPGDVDIGVTAFRTDFGHRKIDATGAGGTVRILGDWNDNLLDFRGVTFVPATSPSPPAMA